MPTSAGIGNVEDIHVSTSFPFVFVSLCPSAVVYCMLSLSPLDPSAERGPAWQTGFARPRTGSLARYQGFEDHFAKISIQCEPECINDALAPAPRCLALVDLATAPSPPCLLTVLLCRQTYTLCHDYLSVGTHRKLVQLSSHPPSTMAAATGFSSLSCPQKLVDGPSHMTQWTISLFSSLETLGGHSPSCQSTRPIHQNWRPA
ncbi:hypothetical protein OE88DRAFT_206394 [Heliocybe sulcata]|uniref:Uncharacterized protein n=1 Tax=Heliocybe sulcata TaxID=5364 RepID=A0A5C3N0P2_9AGAM|nr:hypothetical protein OE88DRAFT_206394 [Heliocybe sulcata]